MGTLLDFSAVARRRAPQRLPRAQTGMDYKGAEIVVFPGVRIERHSVDLGARIRKVAKDTGTRPEA